MSNTKSEDLFEDFCRLNLLNWERVPAGTSRTPDYKLLFGPHQVAVEIKQIEGTMNLDCNGVSSRTVGSHVRQKITKARKQLQSSAHCGLPAILLVHNTVDPHQMFGTEQHDFISAMYGEITVRISKSNGRVGRPYQGRNARLRHDANTSFSCVGHLRQLHHGATMTLYENVYAAHPLPFEEVPSCIEVIRIEVEHAV